MKITAINAQVKDSNRVSISVDGKYSFSLHITQLVEMGVKVGQELDDTRLAELKEASSYGKLYARALEYCLSRPHSQREVQDYLRRKTLDKKYKVRGKNELKTKEGVSQAVARAVLSRLIELGYVDDHKFTQFWVENRHLRKGVSRRKLQAELISKGVSKVIIDEVLESAPRNDQEELCKMVAKKAGKYDDEQKLIAYLARQGFNYDDIKQAISEQDHK
ncbi:MAG: RecX family transcriptional regulator [Candidatus Nomurabacteria bacterium]|jgi:regulatory protein|nr:RecX family transcriptional regulator [Candidatus Nomurabacteria bacterium]